MDEIKIKVGKNASVRMNYTTLFRQEGDVFSVIIPALRISFVSPTIEGITERSNFMLDSFMKNWIENRSLKAFVLEIHKFGFRAKTRHNLIVTGFMKGNPRSANLSTNVSVIEGYDSRQETHEIAA